MKLGEICNVVRGGSPRPAGSDVYYNGNIPFLKVADLTRSNNMYVDSYQYTIKEAGLIKTRLVKTGTLLLTNSGATLGVPKISKIAATINDGIAAFLDLDKRLLVYLYWFLESQTQNIRNINQGAAQPNLNTDIIKDFLIPIPPLSEQKRIVQKIEESFILIDQIEKNKFSLSQFIKQSKSKVLDLAIRGKLVPQDPKDEPASVLLEKIGNEQKTKKPTADISHYPFEVPEGWVWCRLKNIAQHNTGKTLDKNRNTGTLQEYITTSNLYWGYFDFTELRKMPIEDSELGRCTATIGDLLICEGGDAGRSAVWKSEQSICFQNHIHRVRPFANISTDFLYYFMQYIYLNGEIKQYLKGVGIQSLSGNALSSISIPLPPLPEQHRIVQKIETIFQTLDKIQNNL